MSTDLSIRNQDGWVLKPHFGENDVTIEILDNWDISYEGKGVVLTVDESEEDIEVPELLNQRVMQVFESGSKYGFQVVKVPPEVIELTDGTRVESPEGIVIIFCRHGLEGGFKIERFLGFVSGSAMTAAGVVCSVFLPFGKQIAGGSLISAGQNMISYSLKTNDKNFTTSRLIKEGAKGAITGSIASTVTYFASPAIKALGGQLSKSIGNPAFKKTVEKVVELGAKVGAQAAASTTVSLGMQIYNKIQSNQKVSWQEVRQAAAAGALSGLVGGLTEEVGKYFISEIAEASKTASGEFPANMFNKVKRMLLGGFSSTGGALASGGLQNYFKGKDFFENLGLQGIMSFLIGGASAYAQICREESLIKLYNELQKELKDLQDKLKKLNEQKKSEAPKEKQNEIKKSEAPKEKQNEKIDQDILAYNIEYQATLNQLVACLTSSIHLWKNSGFRVEGNLTMEQALNSLANYQPVVFTHASGYTITIQLSTIGNSIWFTNSNGVLYFFNLDNLPKDDPNILIQYLANSNCILNSLKAWLTAYNNLKAAGLSKPKESQPVNNVLPNAALQGNKVLPNAALEGKNDINNQIDDVGNRINAVNALLKDNQLSPNIYIRADKLDKPKVKNKTPEAAAYVPPKLVLASGPVISPAPCEYRFVHYPVPLVVLPTQAVFPEPKAFALPLYDMRAHSVQLIEIPNVQTRKVISQPTDSIYSSARRPEVIQKISKAERNIAHLNHILEHTSPSDRSKKRMTNQQIDLAKDSIQFIGHSHRFNNGSTYIGEVESGVVHGYGEMRFKNKDRYEGNWTTGEADGYGEFDFANGDRFIGKFRDGKMHGPGLFKFANGDVYNGTFVDGNEEGLGICSYKNGDKYEGEWKNGQWNGVGKFTLSEGAVQEGIWKHGVFVHEANSDVYLQNLAKKNEILEDKAIINKVVARARNTFSYAGNHYIIKPTSRDGFCAVHALLGSLNAEGIVCTDVTRDDVSEMLQAAKAEGERSVLWNYFTAFFEGLAGHRQAVDGAAEDEYDSPLYRRLENQIAAYNARVIDISEFIDQAFSTYINRFRQSDYFLTGTELEMVAHLYNKSILLLTDAIINNPRPNVAPPQVGTIVIKHEHPNHYDVCELV